MNQRLRNYGIQNEESDIRVHVCPVVRRVYIYPTACGQEAITRDAHPLKSGYQKGYDFPTATGYLVPPFEIKKCASIQLNEDVWKHFKFQKDDTTTQKGKKAQDLVLGMIRNGLLPIPALGEEVNEKDIQIKGQDIIIRGNAITRSGIRIQVKCDFLGGEKELGGTGNLFLQTQECNPGGHY